MPSFTLKAWTDNRLGACEGSGIGKAIKLVIANCPDDLSGIDTAEMVTKAFRSMEAMQTAIGVASGKLTKAKPSGSKDIAKAKATRKLLVEWEVEANIYTDNLVRQRDRLMRDQALSIQNTMRRKATLAAQADLDTNYGLFVSGAISKIEETSANLVKAIKADDANRVSNVYETYLKKLRQLEEAVSKAEVAKEMQKYATNHKADVATLTPPPTLAGARSDLKRFKAQGDTYYDQVQEFLEAKTDDEAEPGGDDPNYKRIIKEVLVGYKRIAAELKAAGVGAARLQADAADVVTQLKGGPDLGAARLLVTEINRIDAAMDRIEQECEDNLALTRELGSPLRKKAVDAGLTAEDNKTLLTPQMNIAYVNNKKMLAHKDNIKKILPKCLEKLKVLHPGVA